MKIEALALADKSLFILKEIYADTVLETKNGNRLSVCMRDDTIEMSVPGFGKWFRVNMKNGDIELLETGDMENGGFEEPTWKRHK